MIDAYMHVGEPRFGSAAEALDTCDRWGIRTIGILYGETEEQRLVCSAPTCGATAPATR